MANARLLGYSLILSSFLCFSFEGQAKPFTGFGKEIDQYISIAANRYQVSEKMLRGLIKMEDGWYGKTSFTGATGVGQFTFGTWNWLAETPRGRALGMYPITSSSKGKKSDPRKNKYINTLATALLARWHIEQFQMRGIKITDENLYMAHNIGLEGLHRALQGRSTKEDISNMRKNGMKSWMTVNDFLAYQKGRYLTHKREANFVPILARARTPSNQQQAKEDVFTTTASTTNHSMSRKVNWVKGD